MYGYDDPFVNTTRRTHNGNDDPKFNRTFSQVVRFPIIIKRTEGMFTLRTCRFPVYPYYVFRFRPVV